MIRPNYGNPHIFGGPCVKLVNKPKQLKPVHQLHRNPVILKNNPIPGSSPHKPLVGRKGSFPRPTMHDACAT